MTKKAKQVEHWGQIDPAVFDEFEKRVYALQKEMIPCDFDGSSPVSVVLVNRVKHEYFHYSVLPSGRLRRVVDTPALRQRRQLRGFLQYGKRARTSEEAEGVDWKALSHAVRVGQEALELLATGKVTFPLLDAQHVLDIKLGKLTYKEVTEEIDSLLLQVEGVPNSILRDTPDFEFIDYFVKREYYKKVVQSGDFENENS